MVLGESLPKILNDSLPIVSCMGNMNMHLNCSCIHLLAPNTVLAKGNDQTIFYFL